MSESMNAAPEAKAPKKNSHKKNSTFRNVLRNLLGIVRHNWWQKLLCLVVAVLLWGIIITQNTSLTRSRTFQDVELQVQRTQLTTLRQNGFIITSGLEDLPAVSFTVDIPQKNYNLVSAGNYSVRLDLSQIRQAGVQKVPVISSSSATYGTVSRISVESVEVTVEEYISRSRIPVKVEYVSGTPESWYTDTPKTDPSVISIAGPASIVNRVTSCAALVDLSGVTEVPYVDYTAAEMRLYSGSEPVDMTNITVGVSGQTTVLDSIIVEQGLYPQFALPVSTDGLLRGRPAEGYRVVSVTLSDPELLAAMDSRECGAETLTLASSIDINGADSTFTRTVSVSRPSGCRHLSRESVRVTVEIAPIEETGAGSGDEA